MTRGIDLNNPGDIRKSKSHWQGKVDSSDPDFEQFDTSEDGLRAMMVDLKNYQQIHGDETIGDLVSRYAPSSENDTKAYTQFVAKKTGIDPNEKVDMTDPDQAIAIAKAMVQKEQGAAAAKIPDASYQKAFAAANTSKPSGSESAPADLIDPSSSAQPAIAANDPIGGAGQYLANKYAGAAPAAPIPAGNQYAASGQIASDAANDDHADLFKQAGISATPQAAPPVPPPPTTTAAPAADPQDIFAGTAAQNGLVPHPDTSLFGPAGPIRTAVDQFNQGTTAGFADEAIDPIAAGYVSMMGGGNFPDVYKQARDLTASDLAAQRQVHPWGSAAGNVAGAVTGAATAGRVLKALAPEASNALKVFAKSNPLTAASATGAGWGAASGAGTATGDPTQRILPALGGAAAGAVAGPVGYKLAQTAGDLIGTPYIQNFLRDETSGGGGAAAAAQNAAAASDPIMAGAGGAAAAGGAGGAGEAPAAGASILDPQDIANLTQGRTIPLTAGDRTQDVGIQRMEQTAMENGSQPMAAARDQQQEAAYKPFVSALGDSQILDRPDLSLRTQSEVENAANIVRGKYDSLGAQVNAAYKIARETGEGVGINANAVQNGFLDTVATNLAEKSYLPGDVPMLDEKLSDLQTIMNPTGDDTGATVTSVKLKQLEQWKQRFNQANFTSDQISQPTVNMHTRMVGRAYDDFLTNLADTSIVNGDTEAINAFKTARGLAAQKFQFYDSDSTIQRILDTRQLSGQELINTVLGASKITGKGDDGQLVGRMIQLSGDQAPQMQDALKRGVLAKVLNDSMSGVKNPENVDRDLISFANMRKSLGNLMTQKETFGSIFDDTEQQYFKQMYKDLDLVASKQKGAINSSSTGAYMADFINGMGKVLNNPLFRNIPGVGASTSMLKSGFEKQAASIVTGKAEKGLDEFIQGAVKQVDAPAVYYGAVGGASSVDPIGNIMKQAMIRANQPQQQGAMQ